MTKSASSPVNTSSKHHSASPLQVGLATGATTTTATTTTTIAPADVKCEGTPHGRHAVSLLLDLLIVLGQQQHPDHRDHDACISPRDAKSTC